VYFFLQSNGYNIASLSQGNENDMTDE